VKASDERDTNQHAAQEANHQQCDARKNMSSFETHQRADAEDSSHFCADRGQGVPCFGNENEYDDDREKKKEPGDYRVSEFCQECWHGAAMIHFGDEADARQASEFF